MVKVGITGGIGSGKSVICNVLECMDIPVFYADIEAKKIMNNDTDVKNKLLALFGNKAYNKSGLNREYLKKVIFQNEEALKKLNSIVHPAVRNYFHRWCNKHVMQPLVVQEAAILFESGAFKTLDFVITVYAPENLRIQRTVERDRSTEKIVRNIMRHQMPDEKKMQKSNFVIHNYHPHMVVPQILEILKKLARFNSY